MGPQPMFVNPDPTGGIAPWLPPSIGGGSAVDATSSLLASLYPSQQPQQVAAPAAAPKQKENWLTRLLPTAGGLGGAAAGAAGGAALGSVVPIIGTGIGGILGGILGAGVGSGGGKVAENVIGGESAGNNVLRESLLGAGGQALGGVLGKGVSKVVGKGLGTIGKHVANTAQTKTEADATQALANEFPDAALNAKTRTQLGFGKSLDLANQAGVPLTAQDFVNAANSATGSNGYLTGVLDQVLREGGKIDMSNFGKLVSDALAAHPGLGNVIPVTGLRGGLPKVATNTASTTSRAFENLLQETGYGGQGSLDNLANPDSALDLLRQVGKLGQKYTGAAPGSEGAALKSVYDTVYSGMKGNIYNRPELSQAIAKFTANPEDVQAVLKAAGGNQQLADFLVNTVNNSKNAGDLLSPQSSFVNMGKAGQRALDYTNNVIGTGKDAKAAALAAEQAGQPAAQLGGLAANSLLAKLGIGGAMVTHDPMMAAAALPMVLNSAPVKNAGSAILGKLSSAGVQKGAAKVIAPTLLGASQFMAHSPNYAPEPGNTATGGQMMNPAQQQQPGGAMPQQGMSPNEQLLQMALVGLQNPLYATQFAPIVESLLGGPIQKATSANTALQGAQSAFGLAGGGQGMLGGIMSKLGGAVTGGPAKTYDAQRAQLIAQLTALGIPTSAVPELTNTPDAASAQWQTLQSLINAAGAGTGAGLLSGVR